ncbi:MAG: formate--tetrahydrofolate ligase [Halobacteriales archaeon]|nr:formate--tetrahydrofolate ligase [Halobacteriales archaeon]
MEPRPVTELAVDLGLRPEEIERYGTWKCKVHLAAVERLRRERPEGKIVLVTAINPTKHGEGKTTVTIGLAQGLARIGKRAVIALREPSLGPVFGVKGGATGGGKSTLVPAEDINLHFTGDLHAITSANNLLSTLIDAHLHHGNELGLDPTRITWPRCLDMNDRALRDIVTGLGGPTNGPAREGHFVITAASEVMAILCLSDGVADLRQRLGNIIIGYRRDGGAVRARDLHAQGAMAVLLKDAIQPNLVQSCEGVPALVHGGPFANIAHGTSSLLAAQLGLRLGDFVVTEAGFGADLGFEKFMDIFCRRSGLYPACAVLVVTARALKHHGGMAEEAQGEDLGALRRGLPNLEKHLEIVRAFGVPPVVAINRFAQDTDAEMNLLLAHCEKLKVPAAVTDCFARGGEGAEQLAHLVAKVGEASARKPTLLYAGLEDLRMKVERVARLYGADGVDWDYAAERSLARLKDLGLNELPVCVAKTQYSLSDQPKLLGRPKGWRLGVRELLPSAGAGFVVALAGDVVLMPGLGKVPAAVHMDLAADGTPKGVS